MKDNNCVAPTLAKLSKGQRASIVKVVANFKSTKRLADIGLVPGMVIEVVRKTISGPIEIKVKGSNLVLGRGIASKILICPL